LLPADQKPGVLGNANLLIGVFVFHILREWLLFLGHALHEGFLRARYLDRFRFAIMWENKNAGGVATPDDFLENLLPFWLEHYFTHPSYLKLGNKPVLAVYDWKTFIRQLGNSPEAVAQVLGQMNRALRDKGLDGPVLLVEERTGVPADLQAYGFEYAFPYVGGNSMIPRLGKGVRTIPTLSMGWNHEPWGRGKGGWRLSPGQFHEHAVAIKEKMDGLPEGHLGRRMLLLDNWNEWGEGHYIAPHRQYGFGYLDAIRRVFAEEAGERDVKVPDDAGLGPYDKLYREAAGHQIRTPEK
jgi:hypothetical protein